MPTITLVVGDTGGARTASALCRLLIRRGWDVHTVSDPQGEGKNILGALNSVSPEYMEKVIDNSDLLYISPCSSAYHTASRALENFIRFEKVVFGADGYLNHYFRQWRAIDYGHWLAIDDYHAKAIKTLRPDAQVYTTGLPAFDDLPAVYASREHRRQKVRATLGLDPGDELVVWWSHGTREVIAEDVEMVLHAVRYLGSVGVSIFVPRLHPKLEVEVGKGYVATTRSLVCGCVEKFGMHSVNGDDIAPTDLDLAADVVLTATSSEATKCVMLGSPPVVHLLGPRNQDWLRGLGATEPYIPYLSAGRALVARSVMEVGERLDEALLPGAAERLRRGWSPPTGGAAERTVDVLESLIK